MITRPLDLASRLRPEPRNFDFVFLVNGALIGLFFVLFGSRFVLAPGLGLDFQMPEIAGARAGAVATTHLITVNSSGLIFLPDGPADLSRLRDWLSAEGKKSRHPTLLVRAGSGVSGGLVATITSAAREAGFSVVWGAEELRAPGAEGFDVPFVSSDTKRRWILAAAGALLAGGAVLALLSVIKPPAGAVATRQTFGIGLQKLAPGSALTDEATLLDPTPLFLPTEWNATQRNLSPPEPSGSFQSFRVSPKWAFAESDFRLGRAEASAGSSSGRPETSVGLPDPVAVPLRPVEALSPGIPGALLIGFGRTDGRIKALPDRGALIEIFDTASGRAALSGQANVQVQALAATARPPGNRSWQALELLAAVDASGLFAPLVVTTRSGVEEVDSYFLDFVVRTLRLGERLTPGFYRISIGP